MFYSLASWLSTSSHGQIARSICLSRPFVVVWPLSLTSDSFLMGGVAAAVSVSLRWLLDDKTKDR